MVIEFDENTVSHLTADDVRKWYSEHHTEEDLAYVHELVHEMWVYHEDNTYDYEEGTPEYDKSIKVFEEWDVLRQMLDEEVLSAMRKRGVNADYLDIKTLETFMSMQGYKESGGWFFKDEENG